MTTTGTKLQRLIKVDAEINAINVLYSDFKILNYEKGILRFELRIIRKELQAEYQQLTEELGSE
jgi:hypothetical protein